VPAYIQAPLWGCLVYTSITQLAGPVPDIVPHEDVGDVVTTVVGDTVALVVGIAVVAVVTTVVVGIVVFGVPVFVGRRCQGLSRRQHSYPGIL